MSSAVYCARINKWTRGGLFDTRMAYWPDETDGYYWAVEAKNKKGWKRFTEHHYYKRV